MRRHWTEPLGDPNRPRPMADAVDGTIDPDGSLLFVEIDGLELEFWCLEEVDVARAYFAAPDGSTRRDPAGGDHWEFQSWQSRLPAGHGSSRRRTKIVATLDAARSASAADPAYRPALRVPPGGGH